MLEGGNRKNIIYVPWNTCRVHVTVAVSDYLYLMSIPPVLYLYRSICGGFNWKKNGYQKIYQIIFGDIFETIFAQNLAKVTAIRD